MRCASCGLENPEAVSSCSRCSAPLKPRADDGAAVAETPFENKANPISQDFLIGSTKAGLERIRSRLLDLTNRNKLLNFRHSARSTLQVVGAAPDVLFQRLVDGDSLTFRPVPEPPPNPGDSRPTARERAQQLGIPTSFDLPLPGAASTTLKGRPGHIQTLHYPADLESISRRISYAAKTAIEESGTNTLYLIFGFLEWYESESSAEAHLAPLLAVPVAISRGKADPASGTFSYEIAHSGEEIEPNLCLREKLKKDFALELPDFSEDDSPEAYFVKLKGILKAKTVWRLRRQITLALLYFGKLRMYRDLDPRAWPAKLGLVEHPLIKDLFEGTKRTDRDVSEEYAIDSPAISKQVPPVILDADSSQLSALIDALQGKDLVIEGPPGTGKSQTISNLIAIALAEGKTILFVSEKLAAHEVVRRRLDTSGLGIFCLELHSHKTEKRKLLDDLEQRINALDSFADPKDLDGKIRLLQRAKQQLLDYVELVNSSSGPFGRSVFEVIWARERYRQELRFDPHLVEGVVVLNARKMLPSDFDLDCQRLEIYGKHFSTVVAGRMNLSAHPWYGIHNVTLDYMGEQQLTAKLKELSETARLLDEAVNAFDPATGLQIESTAETIARAVDLQKELPQPDDNAPRDLLRALASEVNRHSALSFMRGLAAWRKEQSTFEPHFSEVPDVEPGQLDRTLSLCKRAEEVGFGPCTVRELSERAKTAQILAARVELVIPFFAESLRLLGTEVACEAAALVDLAATCRLLDLTPFNLMTMRQTSFEGEDAAGLLTQAAQEAEGLCSERDRLSQAFALDTSLRVDDLDGHARVLESVSLFSRLFGADYRRAKHYFRRVSKVRARKSRTEMASALRELQRILEGMRSFETNSNYRSLLGVHFNGLDTDFASLRRLANWYAEVRQALAIERISASALMVAMFRAPVDRLQNVHTLVVARVEIRNELDALAQGGLVQVAETLSNSALRAANDRLLEIAVELRQTAELARQVLDSLAALRIREHCKIGDLAATIQRLKAHQNGRLELEQHSASAILGSRFAGVRTDTSPVEACLNLLWQIGACDLPSALKHWLLGDDVATRLQDIREGLGLLNKRLVVFWEAHAAFCQQADLVQSHWYETNVGGLRLADIQARCGRALGEAEALPSWLNFLRARDEVAQAGLQALCEPVEDGSIQVEGLIPAY